MPNWCDNNLFITAPTPERLNEVVQALAARPAIYDGTVTSADGTVRSINHQPSSLYLWNMDSPDESLWQDYFTGDLWHHWNVSHWGTKWELADADTPDILGNTATYGFSTAWSPALEAVATFAMNNPDLEIILEADEGGMDFGGRYEWVDGEMESHHEGGSRWRFCHACDESYHVDFGEPDEGCPNWEALNLSDLSNASEDALSHAICDGDTLTADTVTQILALAPLNDRIVSDINDNNDVTDDMWLVLARRDDEYAALAFPYLSRDALAALVNGDEKDRKVASAATVEAAV